MTAVQPSVEYFEVMAEQARTHWWYENRRHLVAQVLAGSDRPERVYDVGCGTGDNLAALGRVSARECLGFELSELALRSATDHAGRVVVATATALPVADRSADLVASMDVIEHLDDDVAALIEYRRVLRTGGRLLVTVPAIPWLWSEHDEWAAHRRRYTRTTLRQALEAGGFTVERLTCFNAFLVPPAALLRRTRIRRLVSQHDDELGAASPGVARLMDGLSRAERRWIRKRDMPLGLSLLAVGRPR